MLKLILLHLSSSYWNKKPFFPPLEDKVDLLFLSGCSQTNTLSSHYTEPVSLATYVSFWSHQRFCQYLPSHLGIGPLHMTFPRSSWQEMVSLPWVLMNPSSQTTEMELPSWKLSPKRRALMGMPGSGHSLWPNAAEKKVTRRHKNM